MPLIYLLLLPVSFIFNLFALLFVNWWAPLFAVEGEISDLGVTYKGWRLPNWLKWFDTFDADLDVALEDKSQASYWTRVQWLYRNSAYGFEYWVLGININPLEWTVKSYENSNNLTFYAVGPHGAFNYVFTKFGIKVKIGWKAWNYYIPATNGWKDKPWGPEMKAPYTFSISLAH